MTLTLASGKGGVRSRCGQPRRQSFTPTLRQLRAHYEFEKSGVGDNSGDVNDVSENEEECSIIISRNSRIHTIYTHTTSEDANRFSGDQ
jgi:hypothetical protein